MCGRYVLKESVKSLMEKYQASAPPHFQFSPVYNAAPTMHLPVVFCQDEKNVLGLKHWKLIPPFAKSPDSFTYNTINAKSEKLSDSRMYRNQFKFKRCIVPMNGFYEWKNTGDGKVPWYITSRSSDVISVAGLYEHWENDEGKTLESYTIITTAANKPVSKLHNRMPAILTDKEAAEWIDLQNNGSPGLVDLLHPWADDDIRYWQVNKAVGNPRNQGAHLIKPTGDLFS